MGILFYSSYVFAIVLWIETGDEDSACSSLGTCMFTLLRLTFFDGNGFDYLFSLSDDHYFLFFIVCTYLCMTSFGIINGLLSVFANSFEESSKHAFDEDERSDYLEKMKKYAYARQKLKKNKVVHKVISKIRLSIGTSNKESNANSVNNTSADNSSNVKNSNHDDTIPGAANDANDAIGSSEKQSSFQDLQEL